jgi:hypothetical protein
MTLIARMILAFCLLTARLCCPHYGGSWRCDMGKPIKCGKCGREFPAKADFEPGDPFSLQMIMGHWCPHCYTTNWLTGAEVDSDFRLGAVQGLPREYASVAVTNKELATTWKAFVKNMDRVLALGKTPAILVLHLEFYGGMRRDQKTISMVFADGTAYPLNAQQDLTIDDNEVDEWFAKLPNQGTYLALENLLSSMILGTWTAFETLAGDLWETALNVHPKDLADLGGFAGRIQAKAEKRRGKALRSAKMSTKALRLAKSAGSVTKNLGTLHREQDVGFDSLAKIRVAYSCAFKKRCSRIDDALCHYSLDALSLVRNLLVHRAGVVDRRYVDSIKKIRGCPRTGLRKPINLRGDIVAKLINPVVSTSMKLLSAVEAEVAR